MFTKIKDWASGWWEALAPADGETMLQRQRELRHIEIEAARSRLRDEFAMSALSAIVTNHGVQSSKIAAEIAYQVADAMLEARENHYDR